MDAIVDFLLNFHGPTPYLIIFGILLVCGLGLPVPEDVVLIAAGLTSYYGLTDLLPMIVVSYLGVMIGDSTIFFLGAKYGRKLTKRWIFHKLLPDDRLNSVKAQLHSRGNKLIFIARFMPGLRAPIYFSAGTLHLPYRIFVFYDGLAALISVPLIVWAVYHFGDDLDHIVRVIKRAEHGILLVILAIVGVVAMKWWIGHRKLQTQKARS